MFPENEVHFYHIGHNDYHLFADMYSAVYMVIDDTIICAFSKCVEPTKSFSKELGSAIAYNRLKNGDFFVIDLKNCFNEFKFDLKRNAQAIIEEFCFMNLKMETNYTASKDKLCTRKRRTSHPYFRTGGVWRVEVDWGFKDLTKSGLRFDYTHAKKHSVGTILTFSAQMNFHEPKMIMSREDFKESMDSEQLYNIFNDLNED